MKKNANINSITEWEIVSNYFIISVISFVVHFVGLGMQLSWQDAELACPEALVQFPVVSTASIGVVPGNPCTWEAETGSEVQGFG